MRLPETRPSTWSWSSNRVLDSDIWRTGPTIDHVLGRQTPKAACRTANDETFCQQLFSPLEFRIRRSNQPVAEVYALTIHSIRQRELQLTQE